MGSFTITGPDQRKVTINAPDDATPEQIQAKVAQVKQMLLTSAPAAPAAEAAAPAGAQSWADVPGQAWNNLPSSALKTAQTVAYPFMHPQDTVKSLYNIGYGGASKIAGMAGVTQDPAQKATDEATVDNVGSFFKDRYGSSEGLKKTLSTDPVGAAADLATVMLGGGTALERLPGALGKAGEAAKAVGSAVDPIANTGRAVSAVANVGGKAAANIIGTTTGAGPMNFETAYAVGRDGNGSKVLTDHMSGAAPASDVTDMAQNARRGMLKDRSDAYKAGREDLRMNQGFTTLPRKLNDGPIAQALADAHNEVFYRGVAKSEDAAKALEALNNKVDDFHMAGSLSGGYTGEGMDALKQALGEIQMKMAPGTLERRIAGDVTRAAKAEIVKTYPDYAKHMGDYAKASDQINEATKVFSLGEKASRDTSLRKLTSVMRNNVNTNYGGRTALMKDLLAKHEPDLLPAIAGQSLNSWSPRGMASLPALGSGIAAALAHNPMLLAGLPLSSPRLMGELAHGAGRVAGAVNKVTKHVPKKALLNALRGSYAAGDLSQ